MTLLKDNNYKDINVALLSLEADIKNKITGSFDTSEIDKQLAEINSRIDKINTSGGNNSSDEIEDINSKLNSNSIKIKNIEQNVEDIGTQINGIEQKLSDIFSAENKVTDFNTTTTSGIYYWITDAANRPTDYGVLLVNKYYNGGDSTTGLWVNQVAYGTNNKIYFRQNINSGNWTEWKAVAFEGEKVSAAGTADYAKNMYQQTLDLSALDKTKFYPAFCYSGVNFAEVAIHSPNLSGSDEYNQNRIHFDISTWGWTDTPPTLNIREYACFDNNEITIGCIGRGVRQGSWAIWLRGGRTYACFTRNCELSLKTSDYTFGDETYTVGTNYYGGSNTNVEVIFTPQSTITEGAYSSRPITATRIKANSKMVIPIGAPSQLEDGCIWIER